MISAMTKYTFLLLNGDRDRFLEDLQGLGVVDIKRSSKPVDDVSGKIVVRIEELKERIKEKFSCTGRTDVYFLATVFYAEDLRIASISAQKKGLLQESEAYRKRRDETLDAIRREYVTPSGRLALDTMTAEALALRFHLVPKEAEQDLAKRLNDRVIGHDYKCVTGIIGTKYLLNVSFCVAGVSGITLPSTVSMSPGCSISGFFA